jgi:hypothetical protein
VVLEQSQTIGLLVAVVVQQVCGLDYGYGVRDASFSSNSSRWDLHPGGISHLGVIFLATFGTVCEVRLCVMFVTRSHVDLLAVPACAADRGRRGDPTA